jgi:hypothetical protein
MGCGIYRKSRVSGKNRIKNYISKFQKYCFLQHCQTLRKKSADGLKSAQKLNSPNLFLLLLESNFVEVLFNLYYPHEKLNPNRNASS